MLSRPYRVFWWTGPLLVLNWLSVAFIELDFPNHIPLGYFLGSLFAQATLAAAWAAFGPGQLAWRLLWSIVWAISLPTAGGINLAVHGGHEDAIFVIGICLLGQWLSLQLPFWALALGLGLHLGRRDAAEEAGASRIRFGIRHLLLVMLIVGVVLGIGRIIVSSVNLTGAGEAPALIYLAAAAIVLSLPLLLAALMRRMAVLGVLLALLFIAAMTALELPLLHHLGGGGPEKGHFIAINFVMSAMILLTAAVVRASGYGLYASG